MPTSTLKVSDEYRQILKQIDTGHAMLFLGAGSTAACKKPSGAKGLTGQQLSDEIMKELNDGVPFSFPVSLTQACEFYAATIASGRAGLDRLVQDRLGDLQPTIGHYIAASFNWRAVVTTNYNRVAEDAWHTANATGFAANQAIAIKTDKDIVQHAGDHKSMRIFKPHGCVTVPMHDQQANRMVLTSQDYFESETIRSQIYTAIRSVAQDCSTTFVGYSLQDFTFRNIFYTLYVKMGAWLNRSFSVGPIRDDKYREWLGRSMQENFKTTVVDETFDTFMLRLACARNKIHPALKAMILAQWTDIESANGIYMREIKKKHIELLPNL